MSSTEQVLNKTAMNAVTIIPGSQLLRTINLRGAASSPVHVSSTSNHHLVWDQSLSCCVRTAQKSPEQLETPWQGPYIGSTQALRARLSS